MEAAFPDRNLWIADYDNNCLGRLPAERVVKDRGRENIGVTLRLWGLNLRRHAGFFAPSVGQEWPLELPSVLADGPSGRVHREGSLATPN